MDVVARATEAAIPKSDLFPSRNDGFMTSQFTPPAECTGRRFTKLDDGLDLIGFQGTIGWDFVLSDTETLSCSDENWVSAQSEGQWPWTGQFLVTSRNSAVGLCPHGYSVIGTKTNSEGTSYVAPGGSLVTESATEAWCCPSGFSSACWTETSISYQSDSDIFGCETSIKHETEILRVNGGATSKIRTSSFKAYDRGYRVTWNSLQGEYFTPSTALASIESASPRSLSDDVYLTMCADGSLQTSGDDGDGGSGSGSGLSAGAIAGIVVGALAVILIGAGILAFFLVKKKRKARQAQAVPMQQQQNVPGWIQQTPQQGPLPPQPPPQQQHQALLSSPADSITKMQAVSPISNKTPGGDTPTSPGTWTQPSAGWQQGGAWNGAQEVQGSQGFPNPQAQNNWQGAHEVPGSQGFLQAQQGQQQQQQQQQGWQTAHEVQGSQGFQGQGYCGAQTHHELQSSQDAPASQGQRHEMGGGQ